MNSHVNHQAVFAQRLGVIGAPAHWPGPDGAPEAYEPYVREMRIWADLFSSVHICGHASEGSRRGNLAPYLRSNIELRPLAYSEANGLAAQLQRLATLPRLVAAVRRTLRDTDFALMRSPSHFGLFGAVLVRWLGKPSITKWAGENAAFEGERIPSQINRWLEARTFPRHCTLVYGPPKAPHHVSFLPALMSREELATARQLASQRSWRPPWRILCVGRLVPPKGFDLAFRGLGQLHHTWPDWSWNFTMVGDGPERSSLQHLAAEWGIADRITFTGARTFREVQHDYASAHLVIMPGTKEGWPKVIAEAWAHGAVPVAAAAGLVPWILRDAQSGVVFPATPKDLADALHGLLNHPDRLQGMAAQIPRFAEELSLDNFRLSLERLLEERLGLRRFQDRRVHRPESARIGIG